MPGTTNKIMEKYFHYYILNLLDSFIKIAAGFLVGRLSRKGQDRISLDTTLPSYPYTVPTDQNSGELA